MRSRGGDQASIVSKVDGKCKPLNFRLSEKPPGLHRQIVLLKLRLLIELGKTSLKSDMALF